MKYIFMLPLLVALVITTSPIFATTENPGKGDTQRERVGDPQDEDLDGFGGDPPTEADPGANDKGEENCFGKVSQELAQADDGQPGSGEHASDPIPGDDDNETPRRGVGNQPEGHPSDHADTIGPQAGSEEECTED
jgi:hypothetical protein